MGFRLNARCFSQNPRSWKFKNDAREGIVHLRRLQLEIGAWIRIDEETGIDLGGDPNILQAPKSSGEASQSWTGTLVQVEKYTGPLTLDPDKNTPIVMPVGIEE